MEEPGPEPARLAPRAPGWARLVIALRWPILLAWIAGTAAAIAFLPNLAPGSSDAGGLVSERAPAIAAEQRSFDAFGFPLTSELALVERRPGGLDSAAVGRVASLVQDVAAGREPTARGRIVAAIPVADVGPLAPGGARSRPTTIVTFLYPNPTLSLESMVDAAHALARARLAGPDAGTVGLTGAIPARVEQERSILDALPWITVATVLLIGVLIGVWQRSLGAPLVVLAGAGAAYAVAIRAISELGRRVGTPVPQELEPMVVVLVLGVVTDYCIFLLSAVREEREASIATGRRALAAALGRTGPIVLTAGILVAGGTATLALGSLGFFRAVGPGLAISALVGMVAALTLVPALLAIGGRRALPPVRVASPPADEAEDETRRRRVARRLARSRAAAIPVALLCCAGLAYAANDLRTARLGFSLTDGLPRGSEARRAAGAAAHGLPRGLIAPTTILLEGHGVAAQTTAIGRLEQLVRRERGVGLAVGPADGAPLAEALAGAGVGTDGTASADALRSPFAARSGDAARLLVVLRTDPYGNAAIDDVDALETRLDGLVSQAGLGGTRATVAGQTALAGATVAESRRNAERLTAAALLVNLALLALFLRALLAPLLLLAASALALGAALGLTVAISRWLGYGELAYVVPPAAAVLLLALGSDYNVFVVGRIWHAARRLPVADAVAEAGPAAARPVTLAGTVLAGSFALLAIAPVVPLRQLAIALALGVLIDTFVVRAVLVPALISALGPLAGWPGSLGVEREAAGRAAD